MAKGDVLKQYSIEITAVTDRAITEIDKLSKELDTKVVQKDLASNMSGQLDKMKRSFDGLKGHITTTTNKIKTEIGTIGEQLGKMDTKTMSTQISEMGKTVTTSVSEIKTQMEELKTFFSDPSIGKNFTSGIGASFKELTDTVNHSLLELKNSSSTISGILDGSIDLSKLTGKTNFKTSTKDLQAYVTSLDDFIASVSSIKGFESFGLNKESLKTISTDYLKELDSILLKINKEFKSLGSTVKAENVISENLATPVSSSYLKSFRDSVLNQIRANEKGQSGKGQSVKINLTYDITADDTNAINSIVDKINTKVISQVQEKLNGTPIKIPIGYTYDRNIITKGDIKAQEAAEKAGTAETLLKHINMDVSVNTDKIIGQLDSEAKRITDEFAKTGRKIEIEVVGKVNPNTIAASATTLTEEVAEAAYNKQYGSNNITGNFSIDPSSGVATETTLSAIRDILSGWHKGGIPGTQTKEFKEQLKTQQDVQKYYKSLEQMTRIGKQGSTLTRKQQDYANTEDMLFASLYMDDEQKSEINKLIRSQKLKKGDQSVFTGSDFYGKSFTFQGKEYAQYGNGELLSDWKAKWDKILQSTFGTYDAAVGSLYKTSQEVDGKIVTKKGILEQRRKTILDRQKSTRESLSTLGVEFRKDEKGNYDHTKVLGDRKTITGTEDAYAKVKTIVDDIRKSASIEYEIQMQQITALKEQRAIMEEIYQLEQKVASGTTLLPNETERLNALKAQLANDVKVISDPKKFDSLIAEKNSLKQKRKESTLSSAEHKRYFQIDGEIESLFKKVEDLSKFITQQISKDVVTGLSPIDKQIQFLEGNVKNFVKGVRSEIAQVYQPFAMESLEKVNADRKKGITENAANDLRSRMTRDKIFSPISSEKEYDWTVKKIETLEAENKQLKRLITTKTNAAGNQKYDYNAMTDYEKYRYFSNERYLEALRARTLIYEEQKGIVDKLKSSHEELNKTYAATPLKLDGDTAQQKMKQVINQRMNLSARDKSVTDKTFVQSLSDNELSEIMKIAEEVSKMPTKKMDDSQIRGLVQSRIQEDIDYYKKQLADQEKLLLDIEKNPGKYSPKLAKQTSKRITDLSSTIKSLENPNAQQEISKLEEQRKILQDINSEREAFVNNIKQSLSLNEQEIQAAVKLLSLKQQQKQAEAELSKANISAYNFYKNLQPMTRTSKEADEVFSTGKTNRLIYTNGQHSEQFGDEVLNQVKNLNTINAELRKHESSLKVLNPELLKIMTQGVNLVDVELEKWYDIESRRQAITDKIFNLKAQQQGLTPKQYRTHVLGVSAAGSTMVGKGIGGKEFDPFDTTGEEGTGFYEKRVARLTELVKLQNSYSGQTDAKLYLDLVQEELSRREKIRKEQEAFISTSKESYELEKKRIAEVQKESKISDSLYSKKKKEIELEYEKKRAIEDANLQKLKTENNTLLAPPVRTKSGSISKRDQSINTRIQRELDSVSQKQEYSYLTAMQKENSILDARKKRYGEILSIQESIKRLSDVALWEKDSKLFKPLERITGETDEEYNLRVQNRRSSLIEKKQERLNKLEAENKTILKTENQELEKINSQMELFLQNISKGMSGAKSPTASDITSLANTYFEKEKIFNALNKEYKNIGTIHSSKTYTEEETTLLKSKLDAAGKELDSIKKKFIHDIMAATASGVYDTTDKAIYEARTNLDQKENKASHLSKGISDIQAIISKRDAEISESKKKLEILKKSSAINLSYDDLYFDTPEKAKKSSIKSGSNITLTEEGRLESIRVLQERINSKIAERDSLLELENRRIEQILYQNLMNSQMIADQASAYELIAQRDSRKEIIANEIAASEQKLKNLEAEKKSSLENLEIRKQINDFSKGMNSKQKAASFAVDSKLLQIQELEKQKAGVHKNTEEYKQLTNQIKEAELHLKWFREEAEKLGLTLSQTTGRMYLSDANKNVGIKGLNYTGLKRFGKQEALFDAEASKSFGKQLRDAQLKGYGYHSPVVEEVRAQQQEQKRLTEMWRIAGMNEREAELALEIQKVNAQLNTKKKLTKEQSAALKEKLKVLQDTINLENKSGKTNLTIGKGGYVKEKVSRSEFVANQEKYATNSYLKRMLEFPTESLSSIKNGTAPIQNFALATESTLQNIQNILMQGVNVKILNDKYKKGPINYKNKLFGGLNPRPNIDADSNALASHWYKPQTQKYKSKDDYNLEIAKAKTEEQKNQIRNQALSNVGYFALNDKGNVVSLGGNKYRKNNKNLTDPSIIESTRKHIESQKLAIKVEDIFAESLKKTAKAQQEKANATNQSTNATKSQTKAQSKVKENKPKEQSNIIKENINQREKNNQTPVATNVGKTEKIVKQVSSNQTPAQSTTIATPSGDVSDAATNEMLFKALSQMVATINNLSQRLASIDPEKNAEEYKLIQQELSKMMSMKSDVENKIQGTSSGSKKSSLTQNNQNTDLEQLSESHKKSAEIAEKSEKKKQEAIKSTRKEIDYTKLSFEELQALYGKTVQAISNKNIKPENKAIRIQERDAIAKTLETKGYTLKNGTKTVWEEAKKVNIPTSKSSSVVNENDKEKKSIIETGDAAKNAGNQKVQSEKGTKQAVEETTVAYQAQGKTIEQLAKDFNNSLGYMGSSNQKTVKKYKDINTKTGQALLNQGYTYDGTQWVNANGLPAIPSGVQKAIINKDYDSKITSVASADSYLNKAYNSINNNLADAPAWKEVLPVLEAIKQKWLEIEQKQEEARLGAVKYAESFKTKEAFVLEKLQEHGINIGNYLNVEKLTENGQLTGYKFKGEYGSGQLSLNKDGTWGVSGKEQIIKNLDEINRIKAEIQSKTSGNMFDNLLRAESSLFKDPTAIDNAKAKLKELRDIVENGYKGQSFDELKQKILDVRNVVDGLKGSMNAGETQYMGQMLNITDIQSVRNNLTSLAQSTSNGAIQIEKFNAKKRELIYTMKSADGMLQTYSLTMDQYDGKVNKTLVSEQKYISRFSKFMTSLSGKFKELLRYSMASFSIYRVISTIKNGINIVKEMDAAMTELRKVSNDTEAELSKFRKESYKIAEAIGSTGKEIIQSAASWAKLGYSIKEASELAKNSALYANVGDMDIKVATEHMVSTLKAFNIEAKDSITIVDKFNQIGNNYAISSEGIGAALERSASSLVAANNDINQSIALITAGNIVAQDPESVGNAIKVLSLRIRGSKTDLAEMGESTDDLATSTSKLRSEIKALTGVDMMLNDEQYKSTYQILLEISEVWDSLTDVSQANVLEKLAGKTRSSVVAGLLQNSETLKEVYEDSVNSEGSALKENERYMESIAGHIDVVKNKWQSLWDNGVNKDFINFFIDLAGLFLDMANNLGLLKTALILVAGAMGVTATKGNFGIFKYHNSEIKSLTHSLGFSQRSFAEWGKEVKASFSEAGGGLKGFTSAFKTAFRPKELKVIEQSRFKSLFGMDSNQLFNTFNQKFVTGNGTINELNDWNKQVGITDKTMRGFLNDCMTKKAPATFENYAKHVKQANESMKSFSAGTKLAEIGMKSLVTIGNMVASIFLSMIAFKIVEKILDVFKDKTEEMKKAAKEYAETVQSLNESQRESTQTISKLSTEYTKLSKGVDNLGNNVSLTNDEYDRYHEITNEIASLMPDIVQGWDNQGNAILTVKGNLADLNKEYELAKKNEALELYNEKDEDGNYKRKNIFKNLNNSFERNDDLDIKWALTHPIKAVTMDEAEIYYERFESDYDKLKILDDMLLNKSASTLQVMLEDNHVYADDDKNLNAQKYILEYFGLDSDSSIDDIRDVIDKLKTERDALKVTIDNNTNQIKEYALLYSKIREEFYELDDDSQKYISLILSNLTTEFIYSKNLYNEENFEEFIRNLTDNVGGEAYDSLYSLANLQENVLTNNDLDLLIKRAGQETGTDYDIIKNAFNIDKYKDEIQNIHGILDPKEWDKINDLLSLEEIEIASELEVDDDVLLSCEELIKKINEVKEIKDIGFSKADMISSITSMTDGFDVLDEIYADIYDKESFDFTKLDSKKFTESFEGLEDEYIKFIESVSSSPNDIKACQEAFDELATSFIAHKGILQGVTEENADLTASMLKNMGVANAEKVVAHALKVNQDELAASKIFAAEAGRDWKNTTWDEVVALVAEEGQSEITKQKLAELFIQKMLLNQNGLMTEDDIVKLQELAKQAGATEEAIVELGTAYRMMAYNVNPDDPSALKDAYISMYNDLSKDIKEQANLRYVDLNGNGVGANYTGGDKTKDVKDSSDEYKEAFDFFERRVKVLEDAFNSLEQTIENVVGSFAKNNLANAQLEILDQQVKDYTSAIDMYGQKAKESLAGLSKDLQDKIVRGDVSLQDFTGKTGEEAMEAMEAYQGWADKVSECTQKLEELKQQIRELELQKFNNIVEDFTNQFDLFDGGKNLIDSQISLLEESGEVIGEGYYKEQIRISENQLKTLEAQKDAMIKQLEDALSSGRIQQGTDEWLEMVKAINDVDSSILECKTDIEGFENSILELDWQNFERLNTELDNINSELENLATLLNDYTDIEVSDGEGNWTDKAITTLGLYVQQYELAQKQVAEYSEQLKKLEDDYKAGKYSTTEYLEKLAQLKQGQWDAVNAAEAMEDAIIELNEKRINEEIEAINEEIEAYKEVVDAQLEAIETAEKLADKHEDLAEKSKNVADIERKLAALQNDTTAAAIAERKQLEEELYNAKKELSDAEHDYSIEDQKDALNKQYENFEKEKQDEIEALEESLKERETLLQQSFETVKQNSSTIAQELLILAQEHGINVSTAITTAWTNGKNSIAGYGEALTEHTSAFISNLNTIESGIYNLQVKADETSYKIANVFGQSADGLVQQLVNSYNSEENLLNMTNGLQNSLDNLLSKEYDTSGITNGLNSIADAADSAASAIKDLGKTLSNPYTPDTTPRYSTGNPYKSAEDHAQKTEKASNKQQVNTRKGKYYVVDILTGKTVADNLTKEQAETRYSNNPGDLRYQIRAYRKGSKRIDEDQLAWTDEYGQREMIIRRSDGAILTRLEKGDAVANANLAENLFKWGAINPNSFMQNIGNMGTYKVVDVQPNDSQRNVVLNIAKMNEFNGDFNGTEQLLGMMNKVATNSTTKILNDINRSFRTSGR